MKISAISITAILVFSAATRVLPAITASEILNKVDNNTVASTIKFSAKLILSTSGSLRTKEFKGYSLGEEKAYMEFTSPTRDRGTRILKLKDELWIYLPSIGKATKIAGHAMRSSLMGSDFSYEDAIPNEELTNSYNAVLEDDEKINETDCYTLRLSLKKDAEASYHTLKLWVNKKNFLPMKAEYYSKSGKLMKNVQTLEYKRISGKNYPTKIRMENKLRKNTWSEFVITDIQLEIPIPPNVFTKEYLER